MTATLGRTYTEVALSAIASRPLPGVQRDRHKICREEPSTCPKSIACARLAFCAARECGWKLTCRSCDSSARWPIVVEHFPLALLPPTQSGRSSTAVRLSIAALRDQFASSEVWQRNPGDSASPLNERGVELSPVPARVTSLERAKQSATRPGRWKELQ
eukprot:scaffold155119_cov28-Tisochrysis_lutea.AAC.3